MASREFPKTYLTFEGRKVVDGKKRQYWVQDATEDMFQEIEDLIVTKFVGDEPTTKYMSQYLFYFLLYLSKCLHKLQIVLMIL